MLVRAGGVPSALGRAVGIPACQPGAWQAGARGTEVPAGPSPPRLGGEAGPRGRGPGRTDSWPVNRMGFQLGLVGRRGCPALRQPLDTFGPTEVKATPWQPDRH